MELTPTIASYSGTSYSAISQYLTPAVLSLVARAAQGPLDRNQLDPQVVEELHEMHVLRLVGEQVHLGTAVFLETDLQEVNRFALEWGQGLADRVRPAVAGLEESHPVVKNFVIGMLGINQGLGRLLRQENLILRWDQYTGRYARSKVDFDQACPARTALGPDLLTKTVLRGQRYTAVFTGPGGGPIGGSFELKASGGQAEYLRHLNVYLVDAFARLLLGELDDPALAAAAEKAGLIDGRQPQAAVLTGDQMEAYLPILHQVRDITHAYFLSTLASIHNLLKSTASGRQGVPPDNMMMHLWRYLRRAAARELYAAAVLTDAIPERGLITLFYENGVHAVDELLD